MIRNKFRHIHLFAFTVLGLGLSACGGKSENARMDPGPETVPAQVTLSPKTVADRTRILIELIDKELASARNGNAVRFKFFKDIAPAVVLTMLEVEAERETVFEYEEALNRGTKISASLKSDIEVVFKRYRTESVDELISRVDTIPLDMLFVQAAVESASGKSAVSRDCHNIFGVHAASSSQSCPGHPILALYPDFTGSIKRYVLLLNAGSAYKTFRKSRRTLRKQVGEYGALDSDVLVEGLLPYSERGTSYVRDIAAGIQANHLDQLYREYIQRIN